MRPGSRSRSSSETEKRARDPRALTFPRRGEYADQVRRCSGGVCVHSHFMNIVLWVLQVLLAAAFFAHGLLFLNPPAEIAVQMDASLPRWFQLFLGVAEILAAIGLILPAATRVMPWLVTWAAAGIMIVMVSATVWHLARSEFSSAAITLLLLAMAAVVAYMRRGAHPIPPRGRG